VDSNAAFRAGADAAPYRVNLAAHANDSGKSFGDKTREWEMDTIVFLSHPVGEDGEPDDTAIKLEFRKARLKKPSNADQFEPLIIRLGEDWRVETAPKGGARRKGGQALKGMSSVNT
jgi:hypothetical protein